MRVRRVAHDQSVEQMFFLEGFQCIWINPVTHMLFQLFIYKFLIFYIITKAFYSIANLYYNFILKQR